MILDAKIYDKNYLLSEKTEGYREYKSNRLSPIRVVEIQSLNLSPNDIVLDIGCGRGDIIKYLSLQGYKFKGIDYSKDAVDITKASLPKKQQPWIFLGDARAINLPDKSIDKIIVGDVIEHMSYDDALKVINEAHRLLRKDGIAVFHTAPNLWFKKFLFPLIRFLLVILRKKEVIKKLDENIAATYKYHMDEYSPTKLKESFNKSLFKNYKFWIHPDALRVSSDNYLNSLKTNFLIKMVSTIINKTPLIQFFGNDLLVVAYKE